MDLILPSSGGGNYFRLFNEFRQFKEDTVPAIQRARLNHEAYHLVHDVKFDDGNDRELVVDQLNYDPNIHQLSEYDMEKLGIKDPKDLPREEQVLVQMHDPVSNYTGQVNISPGFDADGFAQEKFTTGIYEPRIRTEGFQDSATRHLVDEVECNDLIDNNKILLMPFNDFKTALNFLLEFFFTKSFAVDM